MFVTAQRQTLGSIKEIKETPELHIDSGMGGSFAVAYLGEKDGKLVFEITSPGWESVGPILLTPHQALDRIYLLTPNAQAS